MDLKMLLRKSKITAPLYKKLEAIKSGIQNTFKRKRLRQAGKKTISTIQGTLAKKNVSFFFDMGTLLGIIREGKLLSHDLDIDVGCFANTEEEKKKISKILVNCGCKLRYQYIIDDIGIVEESYLLNGIKFDVNYYTIEKTTGGLRNVCYLFYSEPSRYYRANTMSVVKLTSQTFDKIKLYMWNDIVINVPSNPEAYLAERYGKTWKTPDKTYVFWNGPSACKTDLVGYRKVLF